MNKSKLLKAIRVVGSIIPKFAFTLALFATLFTVPAAAEQDSQASTTKLRVVAYNVACGQWATPEQIAEVLKPLNPDIVMLSEVPKANQGKDVKDWSHRLAEALGLKHVHVGTSSSAGHKAPKWGDVTGNYGGKYKSILSRTPLSEGRDILVEGSGWKRASAVRVETEVGGRKLALYSLHLPGFAHHKKQPTSSDAWEGSKHKSLAEHINAEDASYDIIVGGDFNEWTDSVVMAGLSKACKLKNAITEKSIDHILYSTARPIKLTEAKRDWGPKNQNETNLKAEGCLSDHPWVSCELEIPTGARAEISEETSEELSEEPSEEVSVKVMTYNACRGGTYQGQPLSQSAKMIQEAQADIVGLQEIGDNVPKLAKLLGWNHHGPFLTRYEIVEEIQDGSRRPAHGMKVKLPSGQEAYVFNLHLPHGPFQPYQLLGLTSGYRAYPKIDTEAEAIAGAKKTRARFIARLFKRIGALSDKEAPIFVVGDFNEPSHLDWTEATAKAGRHPIKVEYPTSLAMAKAGFTDAFRTVYPDEMEKPGFTWTPLKKADDPEIHHDRIDYVYYKGKGVKVTDAKVIGENKENADIVVAPYPSDHRAVIATFTLPNQPKSEKLDADKPDADKPDAGDGK